MGTVEYNAAGLVFAALFLLLMAYFWLAAVRANRRRAAVAAEYVEPSPSSSASTHVWQPAAPPSPATFGLPDENQVAQLPTVLRWVANNEISQFHPPERAQATVIAGTTLTVFERVVHTEHGDVIRITCASFELDLDAPPLGITREEGLGTVGAGLLHFESDDFNRVFSVACGDKRFAYSLIDGEMMLWLLAHPAVEGVGVQRTHVLVHFTPDATGAPTSPDEMADFVAGFVARVRPIVYSEWGRGAQEHSAP